MYYVCLVVLPVAPPSGRAPLTIKKLYAGNIAPLAALSEAKCLVCLFVCLKWVLCCEPGRICELTVSRKSLTPEQTIRLGRPEN
jgi:hypothetical protein